MRGKNFIHSSILFYGSKNDGSGQYSSSFDRVRQKNVNFKITIKTGFFSQINRFLLGFFSKPVFFSKLYGALYRFANAS